MGQQSPPTSSPKKSVAQMLFGLSTRSMSQSIGVPTSIALLLALIAGFIAIQRIEEAHQSAAENAFILETSELTLKIEERFKAYRQVLRGARALFGASSEVTRTEWRSYVRDLRLNSDYQGIQGLGFAVYLRPEELNAHEQKIRAEGFPDYRIMPSGKRSEYSAVSFLEPFDWRNRRAFGFDMLSEPVRREAMDKARELGAPVLSGKVRLVQETSADNQAGVLLYLPVFRQEAAANGESQPSQAFLGWVYSPFRLNDLMMGIMDDSKVRMRIYDGHNQNPANLLFDNTRQQSSHSGAITRSSTLELDNREWTLIFDSMPKDGMQLNSSLLEKAAVVLIGALFVLLTASFFATRQRANELDRIGLSLRNSETRYRTLVNLSQDGIAALDRDLRFTYVNPRLLTLLGYPEHSLVGKRFDSLWPGHVPSRRWALISQLMRGETASSEQELRCNDSSTLTAIVTCSPQLDRQGNLQEVILTITDISERKASEERIHYLATHDPLTGLANRAKFLDQMNTSLLLAIRHRTRFALLNLDLDHFKEVNDSLGHAAGDAVLIEAANRMQQSLRASDLLARQGGDEFMILVHDVSSVADAQAVADKIHKAMGRPFRIDGHERTLGVSIGIALYPDDGTDIETLSRHADDGMYRNKNAQRSGGTPSAPSACA